MRAVKQEAIDAIRKFVDEKLSDDDLNPLLSALVYAPVEDGNEPGRGPRVFALMREMTFRSEVMEVRKARKVRNAPEAQQSKKEARAKVELAPAGPRGTRGRGGADGLRKWPVVE